MKELIRRDLQDIKPYSSARDEFSGAAAVFLDANENPFETGVNRYPDPYQLAVKEKLAEIKRVEVNQLLLGNGSDEVIDLLFRGFCNPGEDFAVAIEPSYGMYDVSAKINAVRLGKVSLNSDFSLNTQQLIETAQGAKLIFICSPNNPTGNSFRREEMLEILNRTTGILVVDEAYIDFSNEPSLANLVNDNPRLVILQTLSKAWGLAGIRLGIGIGNSELIAFLHKIKPPYNINQLTQQYALKRLAEQKKVQVEIEVIKAERKKLITFLQELPIIQEVFPSDANFILIRILNATAWYTKLVEHGVIVRNRSNQPLCADTLRISVGTPEENEKLMNLLQTI
jgi:histidinol-phosphate aminotransferase